MTDATQMTKRCARCQNHKSPKEFSKLTNSRDGLSPWCLPCNSERQSEYRRKNIDKYRRMERNKHLRNTYGITIEQYEEMLEGQDGRCAICGGSDPRRVKNVGSFAVDHCHATGRIRQLLCTRCNSLIAMAQDDCTVLESAIAYLERHA